MSEVGHADHPSLFVKAGGVHSLSGPGLRELLRDVLARGAPFRFAALGWSMAPFIWNDDVITVAAPGGHPLRLGEVAAFIHPAHGKLVVHRLVARRGRAWLARGDNVPEPDGLIPPELLLGRVTSVEHAGRRVRWGLGQERVLIARLSRRGWLMPLVARYGRWRARLGKFRLRRLWQNRLFRR